MADQNFSVIITGWGKKKQIQFAAFFSFQFYYIFCIFAHYFPYFYLWRIEVSCQAGVGENFASPHSSAFFFGRCPHILSIFVPY